MGERTPLVVVKVGGSLYDLPDLRRRLGDFLASLSGRKVLLFPGGGPTANVIRHLDRRHGLGEETSHWLALRSLSLNAHFLAALMPELELVAGESPESTVLPDRAVLDPWRFAVADESRPGRLPHRWDVTSDSLAVRFAACLNAEELVLLKSVGGIEEQEPTCWAREGWVDPYFSTALASAGGLAVRSCNLRESCFR